MRDGYFFQSRVFTSLFTNYNCNNNHTKSLIVYCSDLSRNHSHISIQYAFAGRIHSPLLKVYAGRKIAENGNTSLCVREIEKMRFRKHHHPYSKKRNVSFIQCKQRLNCLIPNNICLLFTRFPCHPSIYPSIFAILPNQNLVCPT